jgi:hypothetical protein
LTALIAIEKMIEVSINNVQRVRRSEYVWKYSHMANPTTVGRSVMMVENSAMAQLKYLDLLEGCVRACTCESVRLE